MQLDQQGAVERFGHGRYGCRNRHSTTTAGDAGKNSTGCIDVVTAKGYGVSQAGSHFISEDFPTQLPGWIIASVVEHSA